MTIKKEIVHERFLGRVLISDLEDPGEGELEQAQEIFHATGSCSHEFVQDEKGWLYDYRRCAVCGEGLGTV